MKSPPRWAAAGWAKFTALTTRASEAMQTKPTLSVLIVLENLSWIVLSKRFHRPREDGSSQQNLKTIHSKGYSGFSQRLCNLAAEAFSIRVCPDPYCVKRALEKF